jgi:hypothetical protein
LKRNHDTTGYFNGEFWINDDGTREFSGHVSGYYTDQVIAEFNGRWFYDDFRMCPMCGAGHGGFLGRFEMVDGQGRGRIRGVFGDYTDPPEKLALPLKGIWQTSCGFITVANE